MSDFPAVYVQWYDATSVDSWESLSDALAQKTHLIHTVGWLISDAPERLLIALNVDFINESTSQYIAIPRQWCEVIHVLRKPA